MKQGESKKPKKRRRSFITTFLIPFMIISIVVVAVVLLNSGKDENALEIPDMNYEEVQEGDDSTQSDNVKFDAYFLESTDSGIAKKVRGVCAPVTQNVELYMEFKVLNDGYLKDGKISIDTSTSNFQIVNGVVVDNEIKEVRNLTANRTDFAYDENGNWIKNEDGSWKTVPANIDLLLNDIQNGAAKNIQAIIKQLTYDNIYDTSAEPVITFTGTYVDYAGNETKIEKKVTLKTDFYSSISSSFNNSYTKIINALALKDADKVMIELDVWSQTRSPGLFVTEAYVYGTIPQFNGYDPIDVYFKDDNGTYYDPKNTLEYNMTTREIMISRKLEVGEDGYIKRGLNGNPNYTGWDSTNYSTIMVEYPYEAYESLGASDIAINFQFKTYAKTYNHKDIEPVATSAEAQTSLTLKASGIGTTGITFTGSVSAPKKKYQSYMYSDNEVIKTEYTTSWVADFDYSANIENIMIKEDYSTSKDSENSAFKGNKDYFLSTDGNFYDMDEFVNYTNIKLYDSIANDYNVENPAPTYSGDENYYTFWGNYDTVENYMNTYYIPQKDRDFLILGDDGWVKVYNDDTNELLVTLNKENHWGVTYKIEESYWNEGCYAINEYNYEYETPVKHIRIETSSPIYNDGRISISHTKLIDNEKYKQIYDIDKFNSFKYVYTSGHGYVKYKNSSEYKKIRGFLDSDDYNIEKSDVTAYPVYGLTSLNPVESFFGFGMDTTSWQAYAYENWRNGIFLIEFPEEIIDIEIKEDLELTEEMGGPLDSDYKLKKYETFRQNGKIYLKVYFEGDLQEERGWLNSQILFTVNPFTKTGTKKYKMYAYNEIATGYINERRRSVNTADIYDINDNGDITDIVGLYNGDVYITAPTGLVTATEGSNFNTRGDIIVSPQVGTVFKYDTGRTAQIDVILSNSYNNSIQDVLLLGKFPYEGNKSPITNTNLGSTYTANVLGEITVPDDLKDTVTVYYSTNENTNKDLTDTTNGWVTADKVTDWSKVRTYLIDFGTTVMASGDKYTFSYNISFPDGLDYDEVTYATHGIYFNLKTDAGLLAMNTEPSKVGFKVGPEYTFELDTEIFEKGTDIVIPNAKVLVKGPGMGEGKEYITDENGYVYIQGLYADEEYTIEQVEVPERYILNEEVIKFKVNSPVSVENNDPFTIDLLENSFRNVPVITQDSFGNTKIHTELENETQPGKVIVKYVDREGNELAKTDIMDGIVGEEYTTARKAVEGYMAYGEDPENKEGVYKVEEQTVIYVYDRITTKVIVKYVDREGYELLPEDTIDGKVGDDYTTERKPVPGYKAYGEDPTNKEGVMTEEVIEVIYVYDKVPAKVIVKYVDEEGNELLPEDIIDGKEGDKYTTERKPVDGYEASGKDPENATGEMIEGVIEVIYVYRKIPVDTSDINVGMYIVISLIAIVGIAGVVYFVIRNNKKKTKISK